MTRSRIVCGATLAFVAVAFLAVSLVAAGCGSGSSTSSTSSPATAGSGTVTLWHGYTDVERTAIDQACVEYNATNPPGRSRRCSPAATTTR